MPTIAPDTAVVPLRHISTAEFGVAGMLHHRVILVIESLRSVIVQTLFPDATGVRHAENERLGN
jgi:hypothetical protein